MKSFFEWLEIKEASFGNADIPQYFFLPVTKQIQSEVQSGQVRIKYISSSFKLAKRMGAGALYILKMPGSDVIEMNSLSKVMYDNPHYVKNIMQAGHGSAIYGQVNDPSRFDNPDDNFVKNASQFSGEQAWIVKNGVLTIPPSSEPVNDDSYSAGGFRAVRRT